MMIYLRNLVEKYSFGVCSYIGNKFNISEGKIRLYFIYTTFVAMGSPIIFYLIVAFWLNIRTYIRNGYKAVFR